MPRYYCDYCAVYLTHDAPSVRGSHNEGKRHRSAVRDYYARFEEDLVQAIIDTRIREFQTREAAVNAGVIPADAPFRSCMPPHPLAYGIAPALPPDWEPGTPSPTPPINFQMPLLFTGGRAPPPMQVPGQVPGLLGPPPMMPPPGGDFPPPLPAMRGLPAFQPPPLPAGFVPPPGFPALPAGFVPPAGFPPLPLPGMPGAPGAGPGLIPGPPGPPQ